MINACSLNYDPRSWEIKERGFSATKYLCVALVLGIIAAAVFSTNAQAGIAFTTTSSWYAFSAVVIITNRLAAKTCLEKLMNHIHSIAMEINSLIFTVFLFPLTLFKCYHQPPNPQATGVPILMVNGYLSFGSTWHYLRNELVKQHDVGPVYTMNVGSGRSIKTYASYVQERIQEIKKETGSDKVILVGHSKGGLVSSYYATTLAPQGEVVKVVTIGSPLKGAPIAYIGIGYDAYEMRPNSNFTQELNANIDKVTDTKFIHIASQTDHFVPVKSASRESLADEVSDMGHLGLLFSSRVAEHLHNAVSVA